MDLNLELLKKNIVLILIIFTIGIRVPYLFQESLWNDETVYMWLSTKIFSDPVSVVKEMFPPSTFTVIVPTALLSFFTGSSFISMRLVNLLFAVGGVLGVYYLGKKIVGQWGGVAAAILLSTNTLFLFLSGRALLDVPLTAMFVLFALVLVWYREEKINVLMALLGLIALIMTKFVGVIGAVPLIFTAIYEIFEKRDKKTTTKWVVLGAVFLTAFLVMNVIVMGEPLPALYFGSAKDVDKTFYFKNAGYIFTWPIFILALVSFYFINSFETSLVATFFATVFLSFSIFLGWNFPRYMEPAVPFAIILAIFSVKKIAEKTEKFSKYLNFEVFLVALTLYVSFISMEAGFATLESKSFTYTGFQELGQRVAELDNQYNFSTIYTQSERQIRSFSGIDYQHLGGKVRRLPKTLEELSNQTGILVQLDIWEYTAPDWAYPLDNEKFQTILQQNFTVVHATQRSYPTSSGLQMAPVGFLLAK